jgi:beta-lactamase regulating signal transducer with metallopeptidase domain/N-acetylneuraminic acid mutarotase
MYTEPAGVVDVLGVVFRNSWQSCVLILLILGAQWIFRKHLSAPWRYSLWFLVLIRLAIPFTPQATFSVFNCFKVDLSSARSVHPSQSATFQAQPEAIREGASSQKPVTEPAVRSPAHSSPSSQVYLHPAASPINRREITMLLLAWCWMGGVVALALRVGFGTYWLARHVRSVRPLTDSAILSLLEDCKELMGVATPLAIIETPRVQNPMLYGFVRPRLLLPEGLIKRFSMQELRFVLLHELAHVKRQDILVNWIATALQIVHWFNPLVWIAVWRMRVDRELACDSLALSRAGTGEHPAYGETVIKLLEGLACAAPLPNVLGILEDRDQIKQRIECIANFSKAPAWSLLPLVVFLSLGLLTLTDAHKLSGSRSTVEANPDSGGAWQRRASGAGGPSGRIGHSMIWTGKELLVWGGGSQSVFFNDGARYELATDTWRPISVQNAPSPRWFHAAVWTGSEMIVWGGRAEFDNYQVRGDGGRYDPATDTWKPLSSIGAPKARSQMAAIWTGTEMLIWGGSAEGWAVELTGARYNPQTDAWRTIAETDAPEGRMEPSAVWTGSEMIVWGGVRFSPDHVAFNSGGRYDPVRDKWRSLPTDGAPGPRTGHTAVWTGREMIVWGGHEDIQHLNSGARFAPASDRWIQTTLTRAPQTRFGHCAVWTGSEMVIWGGMTGPRDVTFSGARYNPDFDEWKRVTTKGAPAGRFFQRNDAAVWTGEGMLVFGGGIIIKEFDSNYLWRPPPPAKWERSSAATTTAPVNGERGPPGKEQGRL